MFGIHKHKWGIWSAAYKTAGGNMAQSRECLKCKYIDIRLFSYGMPKDMK